ncbi:hypothetical protein [Marinoscillum sp. 108]|uniref:hypothetical protein n=1 Tax=Marinoscillum sp. 108 TaxID=2653151 RepID=UPI0012F0076D|nr:hypothetical protein [Marinoscillum sp. 108]VXD16337.1 conserved membrane hypothetical protein [Marinoscillum sp. 108]
MKLDQLINRRSVILFSLFFVMAVVAFWGSYFARLTAQTDYRLHAHGIGMILWCMLLITQAYLIRTHRRGLHKRLGWLSYLLIPYIVFTTLNLIHFQMRGLDRVTNLPMYALALIINAIIVFVIIYGLAIYHRKRPLVHARYMLATIFPMFTPVTDRLIYGYFRPLIEWVPRIDHAPIVPVIGFALADIIVVGLAIWDWYAHRRWNVFPVVLVLLLIYHYSVLNFYRFEFWRSLCEWFVAL